jgi:hypothetical protein
MRQVRIKPSKPASTLAMIVGILMVGFGLFTISIFGAFGVVWTLVAVAITGAHAFNLFSDRGLATTQIDIEGDDILQPPSESLPFDERLRRLEQLRKEGLLSENEFQDKRSELLNQKW